MKEGWSDIKKWWADLLKTLIGFFIIATCTVLFVNKLEDARQRANFKWQAIYGIQVKVLQTFETESRKYALVGYDAIREYSCGKSRHNSKIVEQWEDERYDSLKIARESVEYWFSSASNARLAKAFDQFAEAQKAIWEVRKEVYLSDCGEEKSLNVKMYLDVQWHTFDDQQFKPKRNTYYEAVNEILGAAADLL